MLTFNVKKEMTRDGWILKNRNILIKQKLKFYKLR